MEPNKEPNNNKNEKQQSSARENEIKCSRLWLRLCWLRPRVLAGIWWGYGGTDI